MDDLVVSGRTFSVSFEPLSDGNKQQGFIRVMRDVSEARNAHLQLLKAERFATLGQLLSGVAHDVGTPLNVISGYAEFLMMRKNPEESGLQGANLDTGSNTTDSVHLWTSVGAGPTGTGWD